jgi:Fe-S-cluster containining protein
MSPLFEFNWECQRCNACCQNLASGVPILLSDVRRIADRFEITVREFVEKYCEFRTETDQENKFEIPLITVKTDENNTCVFFNDWGCSIHSYKPYYCKSAPVISLLFSEPDLYIDFKKYCKGFGKGKRYTLSEIEAQLEVEQRLETEYVLEIQDEGYMWLTESNAKKESS